ncbi:MAG TPA: response regulator, partial [Chloroflexota bacterium]|nr:response regulator [Chloroflexota bacterium]
AARRAARQKEVAPPTVLVVDDEDAIRDFLRSALEAEGYVVLAAGDGIDALTLCERYQVDAILLDLMMPRLNGLDFLARLRQRQGLDGVSIFLMSALLTPEDNATFEGVAGGFVKPFDLNELIDTLNNAVSPRPEPPGAGAPNGVPSARPAPARAASAR